MLCVLCYVCLGVVLYRYTIIQYDKQQICTVHVTMLSFNILLSILDNTLDNTLSPNKDTRRSY